MAELVSEMAGLLWRLERNGYIQTFDDDSEGECEHFRHQARDCVRRARDVLGLPPFPG